MLVALDRFWCEFLRVINNETEFLRIEATFFRVIQIARSVAARDLAGKQWRSEIKQCFSNHMITICRLTDWMLWLSEIMLAVKSDKKRSMKNASCNWFGIKQIWLSGS